MQYGILGGILEQKKDTIKKNWGNMNKAWTLVNNNVSILVDKL